LPPELGMDAKALFSALCGRLGAVPDEAAPDAPPAEQPAAAPDALPAVEPAVASDVPLAEQPAAAPDMPENAAPDAPPDAPPAMPEDAVPDAPCAPPTPRIDAHGTEPADDAAPAIVTAWETTTDAACLTRPVFSRRARFDTSRSFRYRGRWLVQRRRSCVHRRPIADIQRLPPRRLCYAACAGPP